MPSPRDPRFFERLLGGPEDGRVEYKVSSFDPERVGRYASALANSARLEGQSAGFVLWGATDEGVPVGTDVDPARARVGNEPFEFWLTKRLSPEDHFVAFHVGEVDGKRLVAMVTEAADRVPVRFNDVAYVRIGSATPRLSDHPGHEERLLSVLAATHFESDPAVEGATKDDVVALLDVETALPLLGHVPGTGTEEVIGQLQRLGLIKSEGGPYWTITNLAAVLFAHRLEDFGAQYARKAPRVVFYGGEDRVDARFEQVGVKGYAIAFEGLTEYIDFHLPRNEQLRGVFREEQPIYPMVALRELIANALIHQDLGVRGAGPMIEVFDRRIEISNPGTPLIDVDRLIDEPPHSRNERLATLMRRIGLCEERGSGIDKVISFAEIFQLPAPYFAVKSQSFVGVLYAPRTFSEMTPEERVRACYQHACLTWVSGGKTMTNASLRTRFGLPSSRASAISRVIGETLERELIRPANPSSQSRAHAAYVPYWA